MGLFGPARKEPRRIASDTVVPMYFFDDNSINRSVLLYITLRFDDVLEPSRLRNSLERLMQLRDWRKLGARVRKAKDGKLEYHIPESFSNERPGFGYSHVSYETSIHDHPAASRIPRPTDVPAIYSDLEDLRDLAHRANGPKYLEDFLYSDEPQLSMHIVSFQDATLVSVSWLHTFLDATAMSAVMNAWSLVLRGKESDVPAICNFDKDVLSTLGVAPTEPFTLANRLLQGFGKLQFAIRYVIDLVFYQDSQRTIYFPAQALSAMKKTALQDLSATQSMDMDLGKNAVPFLSDGDVLCAFLARLAIKDEGLSSNRQIALMNAFNMRPALSSLLPPGAGVCLSNAVLTVAAFGPAKDILNNSLAYTASLVRSSIAEQGTPDQVGALAALTRKAVSQTGWPPVFGDGGMRMVTFTNWTKAGFFKLDFGAAVIREKDLGYESARQVRPSFVNLTGQSNGLSPRGSWPILGMDATGGYWVQGNLRSDLWSGVENNLMEIASSASGAPVVFDAAYQ